MKLIVQLLFSYSHQTRLLLYHILSKSMLKSVKDLQSRYSHETAERSAPPPRTLQKSEKEKQPFQRARPSHVYESVCVKEEKKIRVEERENDIRTDGHKGRNRGKTEDLKRGRIPTHHTVLREACQTQHTQQESLAGEPCHPPAWNSQ